MKIWEEKDRLLEELLAGGDASSELARHREAPVR
jgi:hypothetical protein